jgi:hypothetical protein
VTLNTQQFPDRVSFPIRAAVAAAAAGDSKGMREQVSEIILILCERFKVCVNFASSAGNGYRANESLVSEQIKKVNAEGKELEQPKKKLFQLHRAN